MFQLQSVGCRTQAPADSSPVSIRSRPPCWAQCEELKRMDHEFVDVVLTSMDFLPPTLMILLHSTAQYSTAAQYTWYFGLRINLLNYFLVCSDNRQNKLIFFLAVTFSF
ncbi:hypothetical protein RB195_021199 [Necator americanus]|uniref:Uncharacterized protein n=1 Tax=Necator americanus TaxID=51031 RepID=A0ABR1E9V5_NECAM